MPDLRRVAQVLWLTTAMLAPAVHSLTVCQRDEIAARVRAAIPTMLNGGNGRDDGNDGDGGGGRNDRDGGGRGNRDGRGRRLLGTAPEQHDELVRGGAIGGCIRYRGSAGGRKLQQMTSRGDAVGGLVRLSFHDAGTFSLDGTGGRPDGCMLLDEADNGGIAEIQQIVEDIYLEYQSVISRADFWALSANVAIDEALPNGVTREIPFRWGRVDADSCEFDAGKLPDSEGNLASVLAWAVDQLGFTEEQTVALMGAHTLGRAAPANSGYDGEWVPADAVFDNEYFRDLVGEPWDRTENDFTNLGINRITHQWNDGGRMMLTTDMVLAFDLGDTPNTGNPDRCGGNANCQPSSLRPHVDAFRQSNEAWYDVFFPAWQRLQDLGYAEGDLKELDQCDPSATAAPTAAPGTDAPTAPRRPVTRSFVDFRTTLSGLSIDQFSDPTFDQQFREEFAMRAGSLARRVMRDTRDWEDGWDRSDVTVRISGDIVAGSVVVPVEVAFPGSSVAGDVADSFARRVREEPAALFEGSVLFESFGDVSADSVNARAEGDTYAPTSPPPVTEAPTNAPTTDAPAAVTETPTATPPVATTAPTAPPPADATPTTDAPTAPPTAAPTTSSPTAEAATPTAAPAPTPTSPPPTSEQATPTPTSEEQDVDASVSSSGARAAAGWLMSPTFIAVVAANVCAGLHRLL